MNVNKLMNSMFYCQDLIKEFTEYSKYLDNYFKLDSNKYDHEELYVCYLNLKNNLQQLAIKHKIVKK